MTKKGNIISAIVILIIFIPIFLIASSMQDNNILTDELQELTTQLETRVTELETLDQAQQIRIKELKENLTDHEEVVTVDLEELKAEIKEVEIKNDQISETSFYFIIEELWEAIERIK